MKWFTSDEHFDHEPGNILRPPGFSMLEVINRDVKPEDNLYILGDFALKKPGYWRNLIQCRTVFLITGNHDPIEKSRNVFGGNMRDVMFTHVCEVDTWLSHYPHAYWPKSHKGAYHLYGHCHDQREATLDAAFPDRRSTDVSPETHKRLFGEFGIFSEQKIHFLLGSRPGHDPVEFYKNLRGEYNANPVSVS